MGCYSKNFIVNYELTLKIKLEVQSGNGARNCQIGWIDFGF